jgi:hypothetical protein
MRDLSPYYSEKYEQLVDHPLYRSINNMDQVRIFMQHHVFAVWDFMSLIKALQFHISPNSIPWIPSVNPGHVRLINQLVLEEESDLELGRPDNSGHCSHFLSYHNAMNEIGADTQSISNFINAVEASGIEVALDEVEIPHAVGDFIRFTFQVIATNKAHLVAAVLAYGRELLIPELFKRLLNLPGVNLRDAPVLNAYLTRHIELDEQDHGPMMVNMVNELCGEDTVKKAAVISMAEQALDARLEFWDGIYAALESAGGGNKVVGEGLAR